MPIYEYACPKCGVFDVMQKISEKPLRSCPTCKAKVTKQMSNPAFHLKGSGWYITDYARKGGGSDSAAGKGDKPDSQAGTDATPTETASPESTSGTKDKKTKAGGKKNASKAAA